MYVDVKVTVWQRIQLNEDESITTDDVIEIIKEEGINSLFNLTSLDANCETLDNTEVYINPEENKGCSTIELYDDYGKLLWQNVESNEMGN